MEQISFFLEKFKSLGLEGAAIKMTFIEQVKKVLHTTLSFEDITLKDGVLYIKAPPSLKSELYVKRHILVDELSKILGPMKVSGLR